MASRDNPYAPPTSELTDHTHTVPDSLELLASRWRRLGAVTLDLVILVGSQLLIVLVIDFFSETDLMGSFLSEDSVPMFEPNLIKLGWYLGIVFDSLFFFIINGYLLTTRGQTIGKVITNIAIVNVSTQKPHPIGKLVLLRYAPIYLTQLIMYFAYSLVFLIDALFIFRSDRRTLHDMLAGTTVIDLRKRERLSTRADSSLDHISSESTPSEP